MNQPSIRIPDALDPSSHSVPGPASRARWIRTVACLTVALLASCRTTPRPVQISSDPAGAVVLINGQDSGFSTPVILDLSDSFQGPSLSVGLELDGYDSVTRVLVKGSRDQLVYWNDSQVFYLTGRFPLWLNGSDLFFPKTTLTGATPPRLFARLRRSTGR